MQEYEKSGDLFSYVADFHRRLKEKYQELADQTDNGRLRMLLEYLIKQEAQYQQGMGRFDLEGREKLKETWYQYIDSEQELTLDNVRLEPDMSKDELLQTALKLDDRLIRFYRSMADNAGSTPETRDVFERLAQQQEEEKSDLIETADGLENL
jgi:rubrerythrin